MYVHAGDCYMVAAGLFSEDPETGAKRLGGHDPQHAHKVLAFAKVRPLQHD